MSSLYTTILSDLVGPASSEQVVGHRSVTTVKQDRPRQLYGGRGPIISQYYVVSNGEVRRQPEAQATEQHHGSKY